MSRHSICFEFKQFFSTANTGPLQVIDETPGCTLLCVISIFCDEKTLRSWHASGHCHKCAASIRKSIKLKQDTYDRLNLTINPSNHYDFFEVPACIRMLEHIGPFCYTIATSSAPTHFLAAILVVASVTENVRNQFLGFLAKTVSAYGNSHCSFVSDVSDALDRILSWGNSVLFVGVPTWVCAYMWTCLWAWVCTAHKLWQCCFNDWMSLLLWIRSQTCIWKGSSDVKCDIEASTWVSYIVIHWSVCEKLSNWVIII